MKNMKKYAKYLAIPALLLLLAIPLTGATSNAIYLHHQRLTLANLEADLQNREIGLDFENKTVVGRYADGTYVHLLSAEQPNITIGGTLGVVGAITGSSTLTLSTLTANKPLFTNGSSVVTTAGVTGYGTTVVLDSLPTLKSPTISGTIPGTTALTSGTFSGTLGVTGAITASNLTASLPVFTNGSKALVSNAVTGTGNVVMSASPTLTGTIAGANQTLSGTLGVTGNLTLTTISSGRIPYASTSGLISQDNLYWDASNDRLGIGASASSPGAYLDIRQSGSSSNFIRISQEDAASGYSARAIIQTNGAGAGDPYVNYAVSGVTDWSAGIDNSDGDAYVITPASAPGGATNGLKITTAGAVSMPGSLTVDSLISSKFYDEGTFTGTLTGMTTSPTTTARWNRIGKRISICLDSAGGESNAGTFTVTGMPSGLYPARNISAGSAPVRNGFGSGEAVALVSVKTDGVIHLHLIAETSGFTDWGTYGWAATGTKGIGGALGTASFASVCFEYNRQ